MKKQFFHDLKMFLILTCIGGALALVSYVYTMNFGGIDNSSDAEITDLANPEIGDFISVKKLALVLSQKKKIVLLDARGSFFYEEGHIPSAILFERSRFEENYPAQKGHINNAERVIVYCSDEHCEDSKAVAALLRERGHTNISVYPGGWAEWERQKRPVETGR